METTRFYTTSQLYPNGSYPTETAIQQTPERVNVSMNSVPNAAESKPMGLIGKSVLTAVGGTLIVLAIAAAIGAPLYVALSKTVDSSTTTSTPTTTTSPTTTTTTGTTTTTTGAIVTGTQNYAAEVVTNAYHGIQKVRYYSATNTGSAMRLAYPIVYLSGTTFSGSYTNNAWYALHAGCGNVNGIACCTGVCKSLNKTYVGITSSCGTGYVGSVTSYVSPDRAVYTGSDTNSAPWVDYGAASSCGNPMYYCDCTL